MMKKSFVPLFLAIIFFMVILTIFIDTLTNYWGILTIIAIILILVILFLQYELKKISTKEISLIAVISGVSAVSRIPFAAIPSVQPCTFIIICTGYVFGPTAGFMVGATTAIISNMFLGHGPWTIFQIFAWGLIGMSSSFLGRHRVKKTGLVIFGVIWAYIFGWIVNLWFFIGYVYPHNLNTLFFTMGSSIGFDTLHAIGNTVFLVLLGEKTIVIFQRYKDRFHICFEQKNNDFSNDKKFVVSDI